MYDVEEHRYAYRIAIKPCWSSPVPLFVWICTVHLKCLPRLRFRFMTFDDYVYMRPE